MEIAILGGGIGGLSSAIALTLKGVSVAVYEKGKRPFDIGAGIVCWPNATFVLKQLGVLDDVAKVSGQISHMNRYTAEGVAIGSLDVKLLNEKMEHGSFSVLRRDIMRILTERCKTLGIKIHYQHEVTALVKTNHQTSAVFANGSSVTPDLIIGADGRMNSIARQYVTGDNTPKYQGFINWVGVFESKDAVFDELSVRDYWGVGTRFGLVPISANRAYWAGGAVADKISTIDPSIYKDELQSLFASWPGLIPRLIEQTPNSQIHKIFVHDHDPIDIWHKDNVLLIGDAAHSPLPTSGQGACQALEDAWHLANCLAAQNEDLGLMAQSFTELRKGKTNGIIMTGRQLAASIFNRDPVYCKQRDEASRNTDYQAVASGMANGWSSGLPLTNYQP